MNKLYRLWIGFLLFWSYVGMFLLVSVSCVKNDNSKEQVNDARYTRATGAFALGRLVNNGEQGEKRCSVYYDGYHFGGEKGAKHTVCEENAYTCADGVPTFGRSANSGEERCSVCYDGYHLNGEAGAEHTVCEENAYVCANGVPTFGRPNVNEQEGCSSCNDRSTLTATNRCAVHDFTGSACAGDSDCGGRGAGLYCDNTTYDDDPSSGKCEPLRAEGDVCGKNVRDPWHYLSRVCQDGLQCNGITGVGSICTTEKLGALCSHNGFHELLDNTRVRNDGSHCERGLYCNIGTLNKHILNGKCKAAPSDQGEWSGTAHVLSSPGETVVGYIHAWDVDYFVITVPNKGSLNARLSTVGGSRIELTESILRLGSSNWASKTLYATGSGSSTVSKFLSVPVDRPGTYYIKVDAEPTSLYLGLHSYSLEIFSDRSDKRSDASMITDGSTTSEGLFSAGDIDYFTVNVPPGKVLRAYTTGSVDTVGHIESDSGISLVSDDNSGQGNNFDISHNALAGGTYYIKVTGAAGIHEFGNYSLMVTFSSLPDQHGDTPSDATRVIAESTTQGSLFPSDEDYFVINVPRNKILRAHIAGSTGIIGYVKDSSGTTLVGDYNDDFDVSYTTTSAGDYYIWVGKSYGISNSNIQGYNLQISVRDAPVINDDHGDTALDATTIGMSSTEGSALTTSGTLHIGDADYFLLDMNPSILSEPLFVCVYTTDAAGMMGINTVIGFDRVIGSSSSHNGKKNALTFLYLPGVPRSIVVMGDTSTTTGDYTLHTKIGRCFP